jgi:hypothetical protein
VLLGALSTGVACTAILKPRDDVQRCGTADDCDATGDDRYVAVCRFDPENSGLDSTKVDKICVADFDVISCAIPPMAEGQNDTYAALFDKDEECDGFDTSCAEENLGSLGCPPPDGGSCNGDLTLQDNTCIDEGASVRVVTGGGLVRQAVQDQFCKSFFCDEEFVCDTTDEDSPICVRCDADEEFGKGGCGLLYANGDVAPMYALDDALDEDNGCPGPDAKTEVPVFGDCE